jgi:hypothetical protein
MKEANLKVYHYIWLEAHPYRDKDWLCRVIGDGFHIHHMDGDHSNDHPDNLVLIEAGDHFMLHGQKGFNPLKRVARRRSRSATKSEIDEMWRRKRGSRSKKVVDIPGHLGIRIVKDT